jgi:hypothetical protein
MLVCFQPLREQYSDTLAQTDRRYCCLLVLLLLFSVDIADAR